MKKELIWAIVAGILFGLVIAFGAWRINSSLKGNEQANPTSTPVSGDKMSEFKISLDKPENEDVVSEDTTTVSGITKAGALVVISGEDGDYLTQANEKGLFEDEVDLVAGVNQIKITAFDMEGAQSVERVLVVYSSSFEKRTVAEENPETDNSTDSGSTIREKVQQKVDEILNKPKAYLGVVTDIIDSTVQIKTKEGEIRQVSTDKENITVIKDDGKTTKTVKFTDIAIGDFLVAMGYKNSNSVLSAQRILITPEVTEPAIDVSYKNASEVLEDLKPAKTTLVFKLEEGKITKIKFTDIEDSDKIISVSVKVDEKTTIRSIFAIPTN